jgi:hypothetical protein
MPETHEHGRCATEGQHCCLRTIPVTHFIYPSACLPADAEVDLSTLPLKDIIRRGTVLERRKNELEKQRKKEVGMLPVIVQWVPDKRFVEHLTSCSFYCSPHQARE